VKIALIDNGSIEPAAQTALRSAAAAVGRTVGVTVHPVSWKHSDRIPASRLGGVAAWTLAPWIRAQLDEGESEFLFIPFFISPQGAIGSALRSDIEAIRLATDVFDRFDFSFAGGLVDGFQESSVLARIVASNLRDAITQLGLRKPAAILVDHGGPSPASAAIRDSVTDEIRTLLASEVSRVAAASMESPEGPEFEFNRPLLGEVLAQPGFDQGEILIAPLFLLPGRHAGSDGDLARIVRASRSGSTRGRCHFTGLVGAHPLAVAALADSLRAALERQVQTVGNP
jgi:hypothetical protein